MQSKQICLLASRIAKGGAGMVALAGQGLNAVLEDLKLVRDLKMNRVTQTLSVNAGSNGPFNLEADYLRTYDMFFPLASNGELQFLSPVTMEQFDADNAQTQTADFPYEFATDLSTQAQAATGTAGVTNGVIALTVVGPGVGYTSIPAVAFTPAGAAAVAHMGVVGFSFTSLGAGYAVGDVIFGTAGTYTVPWSAVVAAVGGGGSVSAATVTVTGDYSVLPVGVSNSTTNGAGAGFQWTPSTWFVSSAVVTASGQYATAPAATASGGGASTQATFTAVFGSTSASGSGQLYLYPKSATPLAITHRYMKNQPDIATPETSTAVPWFPHSQYLIDRTAWFMMAITGDDRRDSFFKSTEDVLRPYLIMEGDEQQAVRAMRLDPRHFKSNRGLRPTKLDPY